MEETNKLTRLKMHGVKHLKCMKSCFKHIKAKNMKIKVFQDVWMKAIK
jgi:hypothetical protein